MADRPEPASSADDELEVDLLSTETSSSATETAVSSTSNWPAIGVLGAVVVALSIWLLSSVISNPVESESETLERPETSITQPQSTTTSSSPPTTRQIRATPGAVEPVDPDSPLSLIYTDGGDLRIIEFSTGAMSTIDRSGDPQLVVDDYLVIRNSEESLQALRLDDLSGEAIDLPLFAWRQVAPSGQPNEVWGYEATGDDFGIGGLGPAIRVDLVTGDVRERLKPLGRGGLQFGEVGGWPDIITGTGGGVYERVDDGFVRRSTGTLHAADDDFALVEECDAVYRCELKWLDRTRWEPVEGRFVPDDLSGFYSELVGNGQILLYLSNENSGTFAVLDVTSGEQLRLPLRFEPEPFAVGPEGRWLAFASWENRDLTIQTIDGSEVLTYPGFASGSSMVITELP